MEAKTMRWIGRCLLILVVAMVFSINKILVQNDLNYQQSEAVSREELPRIRNLASRGANPDAPWSGYEWRYQLQRMVGLNSWGDSRDDTSTRWANEMHNPEIIAALKEW